MASKRGIARSDSYFPTNFRSAPPKDQRTDPAAASRRNPRSGSARWSPVTIEVERILRQTAHRPDPLPEGPWVLAQDWDDLLFAHWPVEAAALRKLVPRSLEIDTFDGAAWLGVTPFQMSGVRPRFVPPLPLVSSFPEINVRTYVRHGGSAGIWFLSLDCTSPAVVALAGSAWHLPYYLADIELTRTADEVRYRCRRRADGPSAAFTATCRPDGPRREPAVDSFERWAVERYSLFSADGAGDLWRGDIHHEPFYEKASDVKSGRLVGPPVRVLRHPAPPTRFYPHLTSDRLRPCAR
jgi:uncharacterized protein